MDSLSPPVVLWPTASSMVNTAHRPLTSTPSPPPPLTGDFIASVFPDSFSLTYYDSRGPTPVPLLRNGITWYTDKNIKFRNPNTDNMTLAQAFEGTSFGHSLTALACLANIFLSEISVAPLDCPGTAKPPYWQKPVYELDNKNPTNNGFINEDLIVWMREAAFPNFKKLYGVLNRSQKPFTKGLPVGNYSININYSILRPVCCGGWGACSRAAVCVRFPSCRLLKHKYTNRNYFKTSGRLVFHRAPLWCRFVSLDLCPSRLPRAALPRQKGSGADHADLVRRSEPLPALRLPRNRQRRPAGGRRSHCHLVEVWEEWEEHGGMRRAVKERVWNHENADAKINWRHRYRRTTVMCAEITNNLTGRFSKKSPQPENVEKKITKLWIY